MTFLRQPPGVAQACTLPTVQLPPRMAELDRLLTTAVRSVQRPDPHRLHLELVSDPAVAARAADLLVRESACCSFFTFTMTATGGRVWLDVTVPERYVEVLEALAHRVTPRVES